MNGYNQKNCRNKDIVYIVKTLICIKAMKNTPKKMKVNLLIKWNMTME